MAVLGRVLRAVLLIGLVTALVVGGVILYYGYRRQPLPTAEQCAATVGGDTVALEPEQAHYASIIAGVAARRNLAPRAVTIALATAYQESGIRNLPHGDRDSLGLFQQRPSQSWGTEAQIMDPYYAANAFYAAMQSVPDWANRDVGEVAQAVQRSGYPDAYDKHVANARLIASALSGETPASYSCIVRDQRPGAPDKLTRFLARTLPKADKVAAVGNTVTVEASSVKDAWQAAQITVANAKEHGVRRVTVGGRSWSPGVLRLTAWQGAADQATTVVVELG